MGCRLLVEAPAGPLQPAAFYAVNLSVLPSARPYKGSMPLVHQGMAIYTPGTSTDYAHLPIPAQPNFEGPFTMGEFVVVTDRLPHLPTVATPSTGRTTYETLHVDGRYYQVSHLSPANYLSLAAGKMPPPDEFADFNPHDSREVRDRKKAEAERARTAYMQEAQAAPSFLTQERYGPLGRRLSYFQSAAARLAFGSFPGLEIDNEGSLRINVKLLNSDLSAADANIDGALFLVNAARRGRLVVLNRPDSSGPVDTLGFLLPWNFFEPRKPTPAEVANFLHDAQTINLIDRGLQIELQPSGTVVMRDFLELSNTPPLIIDEINDLEEALVLIRAHESTLEREGFSRRRP